MNDSDEYRIRSALLAEAAQAPAPDGLLARVQGAARARRRRVLGVCSAAAACVGIVVASVALRSMTGPTARPAAPVGGPTTVAAAPAYISCGTGVDVGEPLPQDLPPPKGAYLCAWGQRTYPGEGTWEVVELRRVTGGLSEVLAAFSVVERVTPAPPTGCPYDGVTGPPTVILDLGDHAVLVSPRWGETCNRYVDSIRAVEAMVTEVVSTTRVGQIASPMAAASGCQMAYKNVLAMEPSKDVPALLQIAAQTGPVTVCAYDGSDSSEPPRLDGAVVLFPREVELLRAEVALARRDTFCRGNEHSLFAIVTGSDPVGFSLAVALDGCAVGDWGKVYRGSDRLRAILSDALAEHPVRP